MLARLFALLRGGSEPKPPAEIEAFRESISIDTDGPEFRDLYPTLEELRAVLAATGVLQPNAIDWASRTVNEKVRDGAGFKGAVQALVRTGDMATPEQLKALGLHRKRKVGVAFLSAVEGQRVDEAIAAVEDVVWTCVSSANQLHNLRRLREAGITHCKLSSAGDERVTSVEKKYDGRRITVDAAAELVKSHARDIRRSVFMAEVKF